MTQSTIHIQLRSGEILENDPDLEYNLSHIEDIQAILDGLGFYKLYTSDGNIRSIRKSEVKKIYTHEKRVS